ncbi:thioesterase domain-containing protein [Aetokthonos hydrillicola Thurmond2011]|jgi:thioesterase domain-containing protein/acyl carrier protein|uniref:Thioesterase domain-containing protein n=1 Tax=Aetokthonos hydrillicola Thurmond2011 TaxID=2712845 RepID=A0AAP5IG07_9CYAN|nr:thioesterase domain-containing protein [Aetokthonos hydrillicola]MBO3457963.1 hypothetical protein [Aetokthonos hydrillicola CCALA 1050]MBW4587454.1 hypothetical protein [Aetokthonos hydrillicola CCALA 1050]MDR9900022.1 thioesterase domain-containing protein [Aetokthonos hydrillicola Thurmond2011]
MSSVSKTTKPTFIAPRNDLERELTKIWERLLGVQPIGVRDDFFDLDGDSLLAVDLFAEIDKKFGIKFPIATLFQAGTVETLAQRIAQRENTASGQTTVNLSSAALSPQQEESKVSWSSLVEIQPTGFKPPLFCIHPLGGEVLCYRELALLLGSDQPVYGLQPQGLDGKRSPYTRVEEMASHYVREIQRFQPNGPYFLAGYSFGGIVAFEIAQQLHRQGEDVGIIAMIDTCRPGYIKRTPLFIRVLLHIKNTIKMGPAYLWQKVKGWSQHSNYHLKQHYKRYFDVAQHAISITSNFNGDNEHLEVIDANVQALAEYVFQTYAGNITLLRTEDKNRDDAVGVEYDPYFGWRDIILGKLDVDYIPGSHMSVLQEPHVQILAEKLRDRLEKVYKINSLRADS